MKIFEKVKIFVKHEHFRKRKKLKILAKWRLKI